MADKFTKTEYEKFARQHEFKRPDGNGWLAEGETLAGTPTITIVDRDVLSVPISDMIENVAISDGTRVQYTVKGGTAGIIYILYIRCATSNSQLFEDTIEMEVTATAP